MHNENFEKKILSEIMLVIKLEIRLRIITIIIIIITCFFALNELIYSLKKLRHFCSDVINTLRSLTSRSFVFVLIFKGIASFDFGIKHLLI